MAALGSANCNPRLHNLENLVPKWLEMGNSAQILFGKVFWHIYGVNQILNNLEAWSLSAFLSRTIGHVLTWCSSTTKLWTAGTTVYHPKVLWGLASVSSHVSTLNTTCHSQSGVVPQKFTCKNFVLQTMSGNLALQNGHVLKTCPHLDPSLPLQAAVNAIIALLPRQRVLQMQVVKYCMSSAAYVHRTWQQHNSYGRWFIFLEVIKCLLDHLFIFCLWENVKMWQTN